MKRLLPFAALIVLVGAGCATPDSLKQAAQDAAKSAAEKVAEGAAKGAIKAKTGADVDVRVTDKGLSFNDPKSGASFVTGDNVAIPASFPKDVPIYTNGKPTSIQVIKTGSASLLFITSDDRAKIRDWYLAEADKGGWKIDGTMEAADNIIVSFSRVENEATAKLTVTIQPKSVDGTVQVIVVIKGG